MDPRLLVMHQAMLSDRTRLDAYDRALAARIRPGDVVADVGAGVLVLSVLALRHGAGHVYAIEADPAMAAAATRIIADNGFSGRITLVQGDARVARLPGPVDVVVSELMGNLGHEEEMVELVGAVARRHLRPGGHVIPARLATRLTGLSFDGEGWGLWSDQLGYRLDAVRELIAPAPQLHFFRRDPELLTDTVAVLEDELATTGPRPRPEPRATHLTVTRGGRLHAVMGHFRAELSPGIELTNFPSYPDCNWAVWIWPLRHVDVAAGDRVRCVLRIPSRGRRDPTGWALDCALRRQEVTDDADLGRLHA